MANPQLMNGTALSPPPASTPAPGIMPPGQPGQDNEQDDDGGDQQASPEEQKQYDQFVAQARNLIYDKKNPKTTEMMLDSLKKGDPIDALAHIAVMVVARVQAAAQQAGEQIDPAVLLQGGLEIVSDIADFSTQVSKQQGTPTYNDKQVQQAYLKAVDLYRQMFPNQMSAATAKQEMQNAAQADANGDIDSVIPGATQAAKALGPAAAQAAGGAPEGSPQEEAGETPEQEAAEGGDDGDEPPPKKAAPKGKPVKAPPKKGGKK